MVGFLDYLRKGILEQANGRLSSVDITNDLVSQMILVTARTDTFAQIGLPIPLTTFKSWTAAESISHITDMLLTKVPVQSEAQKLLNKLKRRVYGKERI